MNWVLNWTVRSKLFRVSWSSTSTSDENGIHRWSSKGKTTLQAMICRFKADLQSWKAWAMFDAVYCAHDQTKFWVTAFLGSHRTGIVFLLCSIADTTSRIKNLSSNLSFFLVNATDSELRESRIWLKTLCKLHKQLPPFGAKICTGICPRTNTWACIRAK